MNKKKKILQTAFLSLHMERLIGELRRLVFTCACYRDRLRHTLNTFCLEKQKV